MSWVGPGREVPVAVRVFPKKPVIGQPVNTLPIDKFRDGKLSARDIPYLVCWGWSVPFSTEGLLNDSLYVTVEYNGKTGTAAKRGLNSAGAADGIEAILQSLLALDAFADIWETVPQSDQLGRLALLLESFSKSLTSRRMALFQEPEPILDTFVCRFKGSPTVTFLQPNKNQVINLLPSIQATKKSGEFPSFSLTAKPDIETKKNKALLIAGPRDTNSPGPVRRFMPRLLLRRNEGYHPTLQYECAPVQASAPVEVKNSWNAALTYQWTGTLKDGVREFFNVLFGKANLKDYTLHVVPILCFASGALEVNDAFNQIPIDWPASDITSLADAIFQCSKAWLGEAPTPGDVDPPQGADYAALRLKIQIGDAGTGGVVLDVTAIDFPLVSHRTRDEVLAAGAKVRMKR